MYRVDPRRLAVLLGDLQSELNEWTVAATDAVSEFEHQQALQEEEVHRAQHQAGVIAETAESDTVAVEHGRTKLARLQGELSMSKDAASATQSDAGTALSAAQASLVKWTHELERALEWQRRAEARVARAQEQVAVAQNALERAECELRYAESALESARRSYTEDSSGRRRYRDTTYERQAVREAQEAVSRARRWLQAALEELGAAEAERDRAHARVDACEEAVRLSGYAVATAEKALREARSAVANAERSLEHEAAAEHLCNQADERARAGLEAAEEMRAEVRLAEEAISTARGQLAGARRSEEEAQCSARQACVELDRRILALLEFNRPTLAFETPVFSAVAAVGPSARSNWTSEMEIVAVSSLPSPGGIDSEDDFDPRRISVADMRQSLGKLREMLPLIRSGEGASRDFWYNRDQKLHLSQESGYERVYGAFFGDDAIRIEQQGETWNIINGRHRIWLAQQMGLESLPASVSRRRDSGNSL